MRQFSSFNHFKSASLNSFALLSLSIGLVCLGQATDCNCECFIRCRVSWK
ncbi:Uncharacterised protein [Vibrio cholerae]|nr:Uncharacterised protein [Vibrio cholerae]